MFNFERIKEFELNIGRVCINGTQLLIVGGLVVILIGSVAYKGINASLQQSKLAKEQAAEEQALSERAIKGPVALLEDQLEDGNYYIKDGDTYYALAVPYLTSGLENDTLIPKEANELRLAQLTEAQATSMPTLYNDTKLIYYNGNNTASIVDSETGETSFLPSSYWLERFKDQGFTLGLSRLKADKGKKIYLDTSNPNSVYELSSVAEGIDTSTGEKLIVNAIEGKELTEDKLSPSGTIIGLVKGQTYQTEIYSGTNCVGGNFNADIQALTSYELYEITDYELTKGYTIIDMPQTYQSGYYLINGTSMFKYINGNKADGESNPDFNVPYYIKSEEGEITENPFQATAGIVDASDNSETKAETDAWKFDISIDNQQAELNVTVIYSEAAKSYFDKISTPSAKLVNPRGEETNLTNENGQIMKASIKDPILGTWTLEMFGMENKTFHVSTSFTGNTSNMIVKNTVNDATMSIYLDDDIQDGYFVFDWTDKNHAGAFTVTDKEGKKIVSSDDSAAVIEQTYGHTKLKVGNLNRGEYKVVIKGESLGSVYFTHEGAQSDKAGEASSEESEDNSNNGSSADEELN